jgi:Flp pilus assembly protein TadG
MIQKMMRATLAIWRTQRGNVAVMTGLLLIVLIGFVSLGTEIVFLLTAQRQMQAAADSAALGAAMAMATGYPANFRTEALAVASAAGYVSGANNVTITINKPPASGSNYAGNAAAVQVIIDQPQMLAMAGLFRSGTFDVSASAVALAGSTGKYCALSTDTSAPGAINVNNYAIVSNPKCGVASNSSSSSSIFLSNNAAINGPVTTVGNWVLYNGSKLNGSPNTANAAATADPYANVQAPAAPACTAQSGTGYGSNTYNLMPGHFCSGWSFSNNSTLNLAPGTYYIDQNLVFANYVTVNGTGGVTLVINDNLRISISNNAIVNLTAPSTGTFAGIAMYSSRTATASINQEFANNAAVKIIGALYFPNQLVSFDNDVVITPSGCTQVIARIINFNNNAELDSNCAGTGVQPIGSTPNRLVQ